MTSAERERRRSMRVDVVAPAVVRNARGGTWACEVENLSLGGACVSGRARASVGDRVRVNIHLPGARHIHSRGRVARAWRDGMQMAIAVEFGQLSPDAEDTIEAACLDALEREHAPRVLVVDASGHQCASLARALRGSGVRAVPVPTALDAIGCLECPERRIAAVLVNLDLSQTTGTELLRFVAEEYPQVRRVAVGTGSRASDALALVTAHIADAAITAADAAGVVRSVEGTLLERGDGDGAGT